MQYSQEHLKTMVYAEFGGQTECIMGNSKIKNFESSVLAKSIKIRFDPNVLVKCSHHWKNLNS